MPAYNKHEAEINGSNNLNPKKWVDEHADYLFRYAIVRINSQDTARDLVQETFLAGLNGLAGFNGKSSERTWLTAILKHKIIDPYRKESSGLGINKQLSNEDSLEEDFFNAEDGHWKREYAPKPFQPYEDPLQEKEFNKVLQACMKKLPGLWTSVFTMKHIDDEKTEVILEELRLSQANFWVIIHRTKLSIRACLQKNWL